MNVDRLLARLNGVRQTGAGRWIALCPAHEDRRASLSIREVPDGRVLVHCFAGCAAAEVIGAVGMEFGELFPPTEGFDHYMPSRTVRPAFDPLAALHALALEVMVVAVVAEGIPVDPIVRERLDRAVGRIHAVLDAVAVDRESAAARRRTA